MEPSEKERQAAIYPRGVEKLRSGRGIGETKLLPIQETTPDICKKEEGKSLLYLNFWVFR